MVPKSNISTELVCLSVEFSRASFYRNEKDRHRKTTCEGSNEMTENSHRLSIVPRSASNVNTEGK
jgi:hypothetical protein